MARDVTEKFGDSLERLIPSPQQVHASEPKAGEGGCWRKCYSKTLGEEGTAPLALGEGTSSAAGAAHNPLRWR